MKAAVPTTPVEPMMEVGVVTPLYRGIREKFSDLQKFDWYLDLPLGAGRAQGGVWISRPMDCLTIYFIEQPAFFDRPSLYTDPGKGADYADNAERFVFFAKASTEGGSLVTTISMARSFAPAVSTIQVKVLRSGLPSRPLADAT